MSILSGTLGAVMGSNATEDAAKQQASSAANALELQKDIYNQDVARNKPFYDTGVAANANLDKMVNGGYDVKQSPAAKYETTQGTRSLNRQLADRGLLGSGNAAQRIAELSSGIAANDYKDQYARLLDQVKIGTGASASAGASSSTLSNAVSNNLTATNAATQQAGQARASLYSGMGNASAGAASNAINAYKLYNSGAGASAATGTAGDGVLSDYSAMVV